jgi:hypothetical protein
MHGTLLRIVMADVSRDYIRTITTSARPPVDVYLYVRRSKPLDMEVPEERGEALKMVASLLRFLKSGNMNLGIIQGLVSKEGEPTGD